MTDRREQAFRCDNRGATNCESSCPAGDAIGGICQLADSGRLRANFDRVYADHYPCRGGNALLSISLNAAGAHGWQNSFSNGRSNPLDRSRAGLSP